MGPDAQGVDLDDNTIVHSTEIVVLGYENSASFKVLKPLESFEDLLDRCNEKYCPGMPKTGPEIPRPKAESPKRWKKAA